MWTDALGNAVTLESQESLPALNDFVEGFIASEARAANILQAQADPSPIVQAYCAALHMFAETGSAAQNARPFIQAAMTGADRASAREQRFINAVAAWVTGDIPWAIELHEEQAREHPRDLASLKLGQYHLFNRGDAPGMLRLALTAMPAASDVPYLHGMLAFGWEQCHLLDRAESDRWLLTRLRGPATAVRSARGARRSSRPTARAAIAAARPRRAPARPAAAGR
jgi:hypothetical protein